MSMPNSVHIVDYRPEWPARAANTISALREAAPGLFAELEHIGSTAVPGLAAKPVIDLYLRAHPEDAARYARLKRAIVAAGSAPGEYTQATTALVQELTDRARAQLGLPPEPVWEKG
ncbi:GrpB family protein [Streptomyces olivaceiscleroticus]|uniref:GrpB family protein n=1 Tax=Streptomyces olivaceiscleroticus TaxID=68245 RepID=A0ABN0ZJM8_9ACTN